MAASSRWGAMFLGMYLALAAGPSPIQRVVTLLEEMKAQTEKSAQKDEAAYAKYSCWCETNDKDKVESVAVGEQRVDDLSSFIETAAATEADLKTEIGSLETDIAADTEALNEATELRKKENEEFVGEEADMKETIGLLHQAIEVLSKVQLTQVGAKGLKGLKAKAHSMLLQIHNVVSQRFPKFQSVMQQDLFDVLGSLQAEGALPGASLEQTWTVQPTGAAAGATSYNSRSGDVVGLLSTMRDQFQKDLGDAQKAELSALIAFQKLRASKLSEIASSTMRKEQKQQALSKLLDDVQKAKQDLEKTKDAITADNEFLATLRKNCKIEDEEYAARTKVRSEEIRALGEALKILTTDDARSLFSKTVTFIQTRRNTGTEYRGTVKQRTAAAELLQRIENVAKEHKNWAVAAMAMRARLDAFTKVKEAMDKMLAELATQQKEEYEKNDACKNEIDHLEDDIKVKTHDKDDLDEKLLGLQNSIEQLDIAIETLQNDLAEDQISLKTAGEHRKEENVIFQSSMSDQRATINILKKAQTRLQEFYTPAAAFSQVRQHEQKHESNEAPAGPPPKPSSTGYEKHGTSGGVLQVLAQIINDAESTVVELQKDEQHAQENYAANVRDLTASIEANRAAIETQTAQRAKSKASHGETEVALAATGKAIVDLDQTLSATHGECDYVIKYFDVRQKARAEEIEAIKQAKAILSGANFGK